MKRARPEEPLAEVCEARADGCTGRAEHRHHRKLRSHGGGDEKANTLDVCGRCHDWIHDHPAVAYGRGWLVHSWDEPVRCEVCREHAVVSLRGWCATCETEQARVDARLAAGDWIGGPW